MTPSQPLNTECQPGGAVEPVAWRFRPSAKASEPFGQGPWSYGAEPIKGASPGFYEVEPLYAHPAPTITPPVEGWREAVVKIVEEVANEAIRNYNLDRTDFRPERYADKVAALALPAPAVQPEGWKLVPVEPTDEMLRVHLAVDWPAIYREYLRHPDNGPGWTKDNEANITRARRRYAAMLSASPDVQRQEGGGA